MYETLNRLYCFRAANRIFCCICRGFAFRERNFVHFERLQEFLCAHQGDMKPLDNENPIVVKQIAQRVITTAEIDDNVVDAVTPAEIFDLIRDLNDPEHPLTLEQLAVVDEKAISVAGKLITVEFTPTVPHCSMATLIGLSIRVKLLRSLPEDFKVDVRISPGTHATEAGINKQLADKERVAAALENSALIEVVNQCLKDRRREA